jgi:outer membrane receptor protein involved in Fe transport
MICSNAFAQCDTLSVKGAGIIMGDLLDIDSRKPISVASVTLVNMADTFCLRHTLSDANGGFEFTQIPFGYYRLRFSATGYRALMIDSVHLRADRFDFNLNDIAMSRNNSQMMEVIVYAEKPLIESKEGNITFNAGESALSNGSNASDLLKQVPLVSTDPNGRVLVKGKEPKILIDDKPVELNAQQLADLLESMPGSSIEKIEVMTNPPPQYANERGGVINIVTKKGKIGWTGRLNITGGSRGEAGVSGNASFRDKKFSLQINAGFGYNRFEGDGYALRQNFYTDSVGYFNTTSAFINSNLRPNIRVSADYELDKRNAFNAAFTFNQNRLDNTGENAYTNLNRFNQPYRLSNRFVHTTGSNLSPGLTLTWLHKWKDPREQFRLIAGYNIGKNDHIRDFFQQYLNPDLQPSGIDSTQQQLNDIRSGALSIRLNYDRPLGKSTLISVGSNNNFNNSHVLLNTTYLKKPELVMLNNPLLSNDFRFLQSVNTLRVSVRQVFSKTVTATGGISAEQTTTRFRFVANTNRFYNQYRRLLPFLTLTQSWENRWTITLVYRRSIQRPGINELNPSIDYSDPYNTRFGNPYLLPALSHNFDLITGKTGDKYFINVSLGYNQLDDIYSQLRTLLPDNKTELTWQNISSRKEYEAGTWGGYTLSKKLKLNGSVTYTYNAYSSFDRTVRRFRNGGSFISNMGGNYTIKDKTTFTTALTFNAFANPQGTVRNNLSMNMGMQQKLLAKKMILSFNVIDPFRQQNSRTVTNGSNFSLETVSATQTRNFRLTISYLFSKRTKENNLLKKQLINKIKKGG